MYGTKVSDRDTRASSKWRAQNEYAVLNTLHLIWAVMEVETMTGESMDLPKTVTILFDSYPCK
jgi:hypothetical protein